LAEKYEARVELDDIGAAAAIFGKHDLHLEQIEKALEVTITARGQEMVIAGMMEQVESAREVVTQLQEFFRAGNQLTVREVVYAIKAAKGGIKNAMGSLARHCFYRRKLRHQRPGSCSQVQPPCGRQRGAALLPAL